MNLSFVRDKVASYFNKRHHFVYYIGRGQCESFYGIINKMYPRVFTILTDDGVIKSFCYSDYVIRILKIC